MSKFWQIMSRQIVVGKLNPFGTFLAQTFLANRTDPFYAIYNQIEK